MLQLTEPESLAIRGVHANVAHVLNIVDRGIRVHRIARRVDHEETIAHICEVELVKRTLRKEDALEILLGPLLGIRTGRNHEILQLRGILCEKTHKPLNCEIQTFAVGVTITVQKHGSILRDIELGTKCGPIGKRLEYLSIRRVLKNPHLCLRTSGKL